MSLSKAKVKLYMYKNIEDHFDAVTGEYCATGLAEDASAHFMPNVMPSPEEDDDFATWSLEVIEAYERTLERLTRPACVSDSEAGW